MHNEQHYFSIYLSLGEDRTLQRLAEVTGKSFSYLSKLSADNNWKERIKEEAQAVAEDVKAHYVHREMKETETRLSLAERIYNKIEASVDSVPIQTARDVKTMLEVHQLLSGKPTSITQDVTELDLSSLTDEQLAGLADIIERLEA